jgi:hypothetical protein
MRSLSTSFVIPALALATAASAGCAAAPDGSAGGAADQALRSSSSSDALVVSPVADPDLTISIQLVRTTSPELGPESVSVVLSRRGQSKTVPCDYISAGGNDGPAQRLWCELSQGRNEDEVQERSFSSARGRSNEPRSGERFVLAMTRVPSDKGDDVYTLTDAIHEDEGTDWVPLIDILYPSWRTKPFQPEVLKVESLGVGGKNPFYLAEGIEGLLVSASKGLMLPNTPSAIGTAPGTNPPSGGPFPASDPGFALFGDYKPSFVFTIAPGVWFNLGGVSPFEKPNDPDSGLTAPATLRSRIEVAAGIAAPGEGTEALVAAIKAAYEQAVAQHHSDLADIAPGEHDADPSKLAGAAKDDYAEFEDCAEQGLINEVGGPVVKVFELQGRTIYFVAGDVSDTGSEFGFYDSTGLVLAQAYTGQGEQPNTSGIDWLL